MPTSFTLAEECATPVIKAFYRDANSTSDSITFATYNRREPGLVSEPTHVIRNVSNLNLRFFGSGIRSRKTGKSLVFACVGIGVSKENIEPQCNCIRPVYYNPDTNQIFSFGENIAIPAGVSLKQVIKNEMKSQTQMDGNEVFLNRTLMPVIRNAKPLASQAGWNWSISPQPVSDHKFLKIISILNGGRAPGSNYYPEFFL